MKGLGIGLIALAALLLIILFGCWAGAVWTGDSRWGETALIVFLGVLVSGFSGGITLTFWGSKP